MALNYDGEAPIPKYSVMWSHSFIAITPRSAMTQSGSIC